MLKKTQGEREERIEDRMAHDSPHEVDEPVKAVPERYHTMPTRVYIPDHEIPQPRTKDSSMFGKCDLKIKQHPTRCQLKQQQQQQQQQQQH